MCPGGYWTLVHPHGYFGLLFAVDAHRIDAAARPQAEETSALLMSGAR